MEFLGIGLPELLLILVLTLIVVGPQRLPEMAAQIGRLVRDFRRYTAELSRDVSDALQDIEREYSEVKEEWKEVGDAVRRESDAIEAEVAGAAKEADSALTLEPEGGTDAQPASGASEKVVSMEDVRTARRPPPGTPGAPDAPPPEHDRPAGRGG